MSRERYNHLVGLQVDISVETARDDIKRNFPDLKIEKIESFGSGKDNAVFIVNGDLLFRFAKTEKADRLMRQETRALSEIQGMIDFAIPTFVLIGKSSHNLIFVAYEKIPGVKLGKSDLVSAEGFVYEGLISQIAHFLKQLHSIDIDTAKKWELRELNFRSLYENELLDARERVYPFVKQEHPEDFGIIEAYLENLYSSYLGDERNFNFTPVVLYADFKPEHILFDPNTRKITGIIDWGSLRTGDPDYDFFRPYAYCGKEVAGALLRSYYTNPDLERLFQKLDFFLRARIVFYIIRQIVLNNSEMVEFNFQRLKKHVTGEAYWFNEL